MLKQAILVLTISGGAALGTRVVRNELLSAPLWLFKLLDRELVVWIEHVAGGIALQTLYFALMIIFLRFLNWAERPRYAMQKPKEPANAFVQLCKRCCAYWNGEKGVVALVILIGIGYTIHMVAWEIKQTLKPGYWGAPYDAVNISQIIAGILSSTCFISFFTRAVKRFAERNPNGV